MGAIYAGLGTLLLLLNILLVIGLIGQGVIATLMVVIYRTIGWYLFDSMPAMGRITVSTSVYSWSSFMGYYEGS